MTDAHQPNTHDQVVRLRDQLSAQLSEKAAFSSTVYRDQPILMTVNQMKQFVPEPIRNLRRMQREQNMRGLAAADRFVLEGAAIADCIDEYSGNEEFSQYYPTYESMSDAQLRTYLTWRAGVREGNVQRTSTSYAYVYLYELINQIGIDDPQQGYEQFMWFAKSYGELEPSILRYAKRWLDDYVIYYGLDASLLRCTVDAGDNARHVLASYQDRTDTELFGALDSLSGYKRNLFADWGGSREDFERVASRAYRRIAQHYDQKLSKSLADTLLGRLCVLSYVPFERAVFADPLKQRRTYTYKISEVDTIHRHAGRWTRVRYRYGGKVEKWTYDFLTTVDMVMTEISGGDSNQAKPLTTRYMIKYMRDETAALLQEREEQERLLHEAEARAVHIDLSKLSAIRDAADATRDKLIVEDDGVAAVSTDAIDVIEPAAVEDTMSSHQAIACDIVDTEHMFVFDASVPESEEHLGSEPSEAEGIFDQDERELLSTLLQGGSLREFEQRRGVMGSLVIESINEKMLDEIGDIVIDTTGDQPAIIDDYSDDLRGLL